MRLDEAINGTRAELSSEASFDFSLRRLVPIPMTFWFTRGQEHMNDRPGDRPGRWTGDDQELCCNNRGGYG